MPGEAIGLVGMGLALFAAAGLLMFALIALAVEALEWIEDRHARNTVLDRLGEDAEVAQLESIWLMDTASGGLS